jgi:hypothetical protein
VHWRQHGSTRSSRFPPSNVRLLLGELHPINYEWPCSGIARECLTLDDALRLGKSKVSECVVLFCRCVKHVNESCVLGKAIGFLEGGLSGVPQLLERGDLHPWR